ncbi:MAG: hypothetical protein Q4D65_01580 [Peptostreptococcaceae bacterium]|nr:hypothetical protein [Peptostreptococcaceae bacterium]
MSGKQMLFIAGIIMCIVGGIGILSLLVLVVGIGFLNGGMGFLALLIAFIPLALQALYIYLGYLGIQTSKTGYGIERCILIGKVLIGLQIFSTVTAMFSERELNPFITILSFATIILYLFGAGKMQEEESSY